MSPHLSVMIDIETLGKSASAAIASIGAVLFDPKGDWLGNHLHLHVDLNDCVQHGLKLDAPTVLWWMRQPDEARNALFDGQINALPLFIAMQQVSEFVSTADEIWCNGNSFDFPILTNAFAAVGAAAPWKYYKERDLRTLKALHPDIRIERQGMHHNALDDATHQARLVQRIFQFNKDQDS